MSVFTNAVLLLWMMWVGYTALDYWEFKKSLNKH